ncbi:MAG TPA: amidohydrolase family protein [Bryobacteraceae bacterium]|nr:amidohydrolase family protein [Bryobacteraceae bacterium]
MAEERISRRTLLLGSVAFAAGHSLVIDTHMHVWSQDFQRYPVNPPEPGIKPLTEDGSAERHVLEMREHGIDRSVLVQPRQYGWDNRYIADSVRRYPQRFVGHGLIDPHDPNNAAVLEREVRDNGLAGMRLSPIYHPKEQWLNAPPNHALWRKAAELGAIFNVFIAAPQIPQLEDMVRRFPHVKVVVDHLGRPEITNRPPWAEDASLLRLASCPNVWVKFSELYIISKTKKYPYTDVHPFAHSVYDAFGPRRLLFATGMVGSTRRIPLADELRLVRHDIPFFRVADKPWILGRNALAIWRWKS